MNRLNLIYYFLLFLVLSSCSKVNEQFLNNLNPTPTRYLYVASGACYGGGVAVSTGSNTIVKYRLDTGQFISTIADYSSVAGASIAGMSDSSGGNLLVAIETGATNRWVDQVRKDGSSRNSVNTNPTAFTTVLHGITTLADGSYLISKTASIEKFGPTAARITIAGNAFITAPAGNCATATTNMVNQIELPNGKIVFAHAGATPNNKIGIISSSGYSVAGDCLITSAVVGPVTTSLPTALVYTTSGKLLVAYGSTTTTSNAIYAYDINTTTNAVTNATSAYSNTTYVQGPSAMVEDSITGDIYVANALNSMNTIERFKFEPSSKLMTRVGNVPFINSNIYTRCVTGMVVTTE